MLILFQFFQNHPLYKHYIQYKAIINNLDNVVCLTKLISDKSNNQSKSISAMVKEYYLV